MSQSASGCSSGEQASDEAGLSKEAWAYLEGKVDTLKEWGLLDTAAEIVRDMQVMNNEAKRLGVCIKRRGS